MLLSFDNLLLFYKVSLSVMQLTHSDITYHWLPVVWQILAASSVYYLQLPEKQNRIVNEKWHATRRFVDSDNQFTSINIQNLS